MRDGRNETDVHIMQARQLTRMKQLELEGKSGNNETFNKVRCHQERMRCLADLPVQHLPLLERDRQRFLQVNVLARVYRNQHVQWRGGEKAGVGVLARNQFSKAWSDLQF